MSDNNQQIGNIEWCDLTVSNAEDIKDFYSKVVGWEAHPTSMGEYDDYAMNLPENKECVTGICHAKGPNKNMPAQWLMYVRVVDVEASARDCLDAGGQVLEGPRPMGSSKLCVIKDPAGAMLALVSD